MHVQRLHGRRNACMGASPAEVSPQPLIILCYELRVYTISTDRNCFLLFIHIFKSSFSALEAR